MGSMERQISQRSKVKNIQERVDALEGEIPRIIASVSEALNGQAQQAAQLGQVLAAVVELLGTAGVDAKIKELHERKEAQRLADAVKRVEDGVAKGELVPTTEIGERSLIIGVESDKDGNVLPPGRAQVMFDGVRPEFQEKLKGKGPGTVFEVPSGGNFTVTEAYNVVEKVAPAAAALESSGSPGEVAPSSEGSIPSATVGYSTPVEA